MEPFSTLDQISAPGTLERGGSDRAGCRLSRWGLRACLEQA